MIISSVNNNLELVLRLVVHDSSAQGHFIEFVIDAGFEGELQLPASIVAALALPFEYQGRARLANGSTVTAPVHRAVVDWDGAVRMVEVVASTGGLPLLGMGLLRDYDLRARCQPGGLIEIEKAPLPGRPRRQPSAPEAHATSGASSRQSADRPNRMTGPSIVAPSRGLASCPPARGAPAGAGKALSDRGRVTIRSSNKTSRLNPVSSASRGFVRAS